MSAEQYRILNNLTEVSQVFTIHEYTKLIYPSEKFLCFQEICIPDTPPIYRLINHPFKKILNLFCLSQKLISLQTISDNSQLIDNQNHNKQYLQIVCYNNDNTETFIRLNNNLSGVVLIAYNKDYNWICIAIEQKRDIELILIDFSLRQVRAKGYLQGKISSLEIDGNGVISILLQGKLVEFKVQEDVNELRLIEENSTKTNDKFIKHFAINQCYLLESKNILAILENEKIEEIPDTYCRDQTIIQVLTIQSGFTILTKNFIKIFRLVSSQYSLASNISLPQIFPTRISFSLQYDIMVIYSEYHKSLYYHTNFHNYTDKNQLKNQQSSKIVLQQIHHYAHSELKVYPSQQSRFVTTLFNRLSIYSSITCKCTLQVDLINQQIINNIPNKVVQPNKGETILGATLHKTEPILALSFPSQIRIYYILFEEIKLIKQIPISRCKHLYYNNSGTILSGVTIGRNGAKIMLIDTNNYNLIETINVSKPFISLQWNNFDQRIYAFHESGYSFWQMGTSFKIRNDSIVKFEKVDGGVLVENSLIIWQQKMIHVLKDDVVIQTIKCQQKLSKIIWKNDIYTLIFDGRIVMKSKNLKVDEVKRRGINLATNQSQQCFQVYPLQSNKLICLSKKGNITILISGKEIKNQTEIVCMDVKTIKALIIKNKAYEDQIQIVHSEMSTLVEHYKENFQNRMQQRENQFAIQMSEKEQSELKRKEQKKKLERVIEQNIEVYEKEMMGQVRQLEKLYQRKLAITTNKLLTSEEINFRNMQVAQQNLKILQQKYGNDIHKIRKIYQAEMEKNYDQEKHSHEIIKIRKQYQSLLYNLQEQNQLLLFNYQENASEKLATLKKNVNNWENKYSEVISKKKNIEEQMNQSAVNMQRLMDRLNSMQTSKEEADRRCQYLNSQLKRLEQSFNIKIATIEVQQQKIQDLQKSNQVLRYRVIELKGESEPRSSQLNKIKHNIGNLQEEYNKIFKQSADYEQKIQILKKETAKLKQQSDLINRKLLKMMKREDEVIDKVRDITKAPIQCIRKELLALLNKIEIQKDEGNSKRLIKHQSPIGQLNRMRIHLQTSLNEKIQLNQKSQEQKEFQIKRKNNQNAELLRQINDLRRKLKQTEIDLKQKNNILSDLKYGTQGSKIQIQPAERQTRSISKELTRNKTRQTFYQKSLFKTYWKEKRMKTEQGSRRKKSTNSLVRQNVPVQIQNSSSEIDFLRKKIEEKQLIIKQLINRLQTASVKF